MGPGGLAAAVGRLDREQRLRRRQRAKRVGAVREGQRARRAAAAVPRESPRCQTPFAANR